VILPAETARAWGKNYEIGVKEIHPIRSMVTHLILFGPLALPGQMVPDQLQAGGRIQGKIKVRTDQGGNDFADGLLPAVWHFGPPCPMQMKCLSNYLIGQDSPGLEEFGPKPGDISPAGGIGVPLG
jgi:hypothetical protein